jgi:hypothetical protein
MRTISEKGGGEKTGNRPGHGSPQEETPYLKSIIKREQRSGKG